MKRIMKQLHEFVILPCIALPLLCSCFSVSASVQLVHPISIGPRAGGFARNTVAVPNMQSSLFYNPAGLAFSPVRNVWVSFDILSQSTESSFFDNVQTEDLQRVRLSRAGMSVALPTEQGGMAVAGGLMEPFIFDDIVSFSGTYTDASGQTINVDRYFKTFGGLRYWSAGMGVQVLPNFSFGAALALVTGRQEIRHTFLETVNDSIRNPVQDDFDRNVERHYTGTDLRFGLLYYLRNRFSVGAAITLPQRIDFKENVAEDYPHSPDRSSFSETYRGKLISSYRARAGLGVYLPFATLTGEASVRAPYSFVYPNERIPENSPARYAKLGAGGGVEIPLVMLPLLLRAGYSWKEFDLHSFIPKYDDFTLNWSAEGIVPTKDRKTIAAGLELVVSNFTMHGLYEYQRWELTTRETLVQESRFHVFRLGSSIRF